MADGGRIHITASATVPRCAPEPSRGGYDRSDSERSGAAMNINKTRSWLYLMARLLGDVNAVKKGRVGRRAGRRIAGKYTGRGLGKLFK
jgi:hypothetical protein